VFVGVVQVAATAISLLLVQKSLIVCLSSCVCTRNLNNEAANSQLRMLHHRKCTYIYIYIQVKYNNFNIRFVTQVNIIITTVTQRLLLKSLFPTDCVYAL